MNKLGYGLLSLLATKPMSGYKLTAIINVYWRSTHSAIYPLLSELEEKGYITSTVQEQISKPNKKIYSLTTTGEENLHTWLLSETSDPVSRDEMMLKLFCIKSLPPETSEKLFNEFEEKCNARMIAYQNHIDALKQKHSEKDDVKAETMFGTYIIIQRSLNHVMLDLEWCKWARNLYHSKDFDFLNYDFNKKETS